MDAPHDGDPADDTDDLTALLAPTQVRFRPGPTPLSAPSSPPGPVDPGTPVDPDPARASATVPGVRPTTSSASTGTLGQRVGVGRWFQPVPGGVLPRADPDRGPVAVVRADPGTPVHAITAGTVRRVLPGVSGGGVELHVAGGGTFVYTGTAPVVWTVQDDDDVDAGTILGVVATGAAGPTSTSGGTDGTRADLLVLAVDELGLPLDAVDLLVGLPDPGELALRPQGGGLGVDPYELDLALLARPGSPP